MTVYNYLIIAWTIIIAFFSKRIYKSYFNPCNCMNGIWAVCSTCSTMNVFGLYIPEENTFLYIFVFLFVFSLTAICMHIFLFREKNYYGMAFSDKLDINPNITGVILGLMLVFLLPVLIKSLGYVSAGDWKSLRYQYLLGANGALLSHLQTYVYTYLIRSFFVTLSILATYSLVTASPHSGALMIQALIGIVIHAVVSGGRKEVFNIIVFFGIAILINNKKKYNLKSGVLHIERRTLRIFAVFVIFVPLLIGALVYMTSQRSHFGLSVLGTFWLYFVGPMCYLDIVVNNFSLFAITGDGLLYGKATLGFLTGPVSTLLTFLLRTDYKGADHLINLYAEKYYFVSSNARFNAASTIIYPFLRDFGNVGIVLGTFIFATLVSMVVYFSVRGKNKCFWNCLLMLVYFTIIFSIWRYTLLYSDGYMVIPWLFVITGAHLFKDKRKRLRFS